MSSKYLYPCSKISFIIYFPDVDIAIAVYNVNYIRPSMLTTFAVIVAYTFMIEKGMKIITIAVSVFY